MCLADRNMHAQDLLAKALEIREAAASVVEPALRAELMEIALKFERLALAADELPEDKQAPSHPLSSDVVFLRQPIIE